MRKLNQGLSLLQEQNVLRWKKQSKLVCFIVEQRWLRYALHQIPEFSQTSWTLAYFRASCNLHRSSRIRSPKKWLKSLYTSQCLTFFSNCSSWKIEMEVHPFLPPPFPPPPLPPEGQSINGCVSNTNFWMFSSPRFHPQDPSHSTKSLITIAEAANSIFPHPLIHPPIPPPYVVLPMKQNEHMFGDTQGLCVNICTRNTW